MTFWDFIVFFFWTYVFIAYLVILFRIVVDIFRDQSLNGWMKAVWVVFLVFVPFITAIVYLIARGGRMRETELSTARELRSQEENYIRSVASSSPADEIAKAKTLLDSGTISQQEYDGLKARALSGARQPMDVS